MFTKSFLLGALLGAAFLPLVEAQTTVVEPAPPPSDSVTLGGFYLNSFLNPATDGNPNSGLRDQNNNYLTGGDGANGNGAVLQFGYFSLPTAGKSTLTYDANDWASFTALTGDGPVNRITTMGDSGVPAGFDGLFTISIDLTLDADGDVLPNPGGYRLGFMFYNDTTISSSTHFNVVTSDDAGWFLPDPATPPATSVRMNMDLNPLTWQSGAGGAFQTVILLAPEPSTGLLALLGFLPLLARRRSRA